MGLEPPSVEALKAIPGRGEAPPRIRRRGIKLPEATEAGRLSFQCLEMSQERRQKCRQGSMSISPVNNLNSYIQSVLNTALQGIGSSSSTTGNNLTSIDPSSLQLQPDTSQLSPFAQVLSELQQLQQSDPTKYQQVTGQIATNLQSAAQTAQTQGNTMAANQLNQLATDFTNASQNNQLPNIQDLAMALGAGHHHHHHVHSGSAGSGNDSSSSSSSPSAASTSSSSGTSQSLDQLLAAFQTNGTQNAAFDPMSIIMSTLASSGISASQS